MIRPPFYLREEITPQIVELLTSVTLGTNGAKYRHLNTEERIHQLYKPLFLTLERRNKVLGTVTFCRRPVGWYIRYFAFNPHLQSKGAKKSSNQGLLKRQLTNFFEQHLGEKTNDKSAELMYAYIDPRNERSLWMSEQFNFKTVATIATQTFSRVEPKHEPNVKKLSGSYLEEAKQKISEHFTKHQLFFEKHTYNDSPMYGYFEADELVALVKVYHANWIIERLPGPSGGFLTTAIPYLPWLRKIIQPKKHNFLVFESLWYKPSHSTKIEKLMEGALYCENRNSAIWWVDEKDAVYNDNKDVINWGLLHKLNGVSKVSLVVKSNKKLEASSAPYFVTGFDFI